MVNKDLEIAKSIPMKPIKDVASSIGILEDDLEMYGKYKAKVSSSLYHSYVEKKDGKLILVTAINPTAAGEGKTTTTIGLADGLTLLGKKTVGALREPSLGPVFGLKGGACGGGYAQVVPMSDINLHFTGDMHAITTANNLIAAVLDNSIYQGNPLQIDVNRIVFKRCLDMNDRTLRNITIAQGASTNGVERKDGFVITVASEMMAILCLATDLKDFEQRVSRMIVAYDVNGNEVRVKDLGCEGAVSIIMKDALKPNLVQSLEHTPFFIHGGPFANIAHGCNSIQATKFALKLGDYVVTEAGFGADLGAEKFLNIKCRAANLKPDAIVLVATIRALKMHGGVEKDHLNEENVEAMLKGCSNLEQHMASLDSFGLPYVIAINQFACDTNEEIDALEAWCKNRHVDVALCNGFEEGGKGMLDLANKVVALCEKESTFTYTYALEDSIEEKITKIAKTIYGADGIELSDEAKEKIALYTKMHYDNLPICMAKTPNSLSDQKDLKGKPEHFKIHVRDLSLSNGAGFIVCYTGKVLTMPGLPKDPAALHMGVNEEEQIFGLF